MDYNCQKVEGLKLAAAESPPSPLLGARAVDSFQSSEMDLAKRELRGAAG